MVLSAEQRRRVNEIAAELTDIVGGCLHPDGSPMTFDELENECIDVGDLITTAVLQQRVSQRSHHQLTPCCPDCGRRGEPLADDEARVVQTDRGEVAWMEPNLYCRYCRRSFFPSLR